MSEQEFTLRQADQARSDFAVVESDLQIIMEQIARLPSRAYISRQLLLAVFTIVAAIATVGLVLAR